jgi:hypothetical protein
LIRAIVAAGGFALLIGGLAMLVLPGPGALAVAFGLATLALEFGWAERLLRRTAGLTAVTMCRTGPGGRCCSPPARRPPSLPRSR